MRPFSSLLLVAACVLGQGIATREVKPAARAAFSGKPWNSKFVDIGATAGLNEPMIYGDDVRATYIVETSSGGVAVIDYNKDNWPDLLFIGGRRLESTPGLLSNRLYRNNGDGTFADVTVEAGLGWECWCMSAAVADVDNDGWEDLLITAWGHSRLYRNSGKGGFVDVTAESGLSREAARWDSGASFADFDRDGDLDLFVANYVDFVMEKVPRPGQNANCVWKGLAVMCGPRGLPAGRHRFYRNSLAQTGGAVFRDESEQAGVAAAPRTYGMTVVTVDLDDDGWTDAYIASDSTPSLFFRNDKGERFSEEGIERGIALDENGAEQAGMGVAIGDYNLDGRLDLFKTHFADDTHNLFRNEGEGLFSDATMPAGLAVETRYVGWGNHITDFDLDGLPDIAMVTGNVYPDTATKLPSYPYKTPRLLFRNLGNGRFEQIPWNSGVQSSRGSATVDFDNDGDADLVVWNRNAKPTLYRNDVAPTAQSQWLRLKLLTAAGAPAIGARATVTYGLRTQAQEVQSQGSFYSRNDPRLHYGLGAAKTASVSIRWPDGQQTKAMAIAGKEMTLTQPASKAASR